MITDFAIKTLRANNLEFSYIEAGQGPLVLLLHGFPDNARTWEEIMPQLASAGFRAVAIFGRGYFPSEIPSDGNFSVETMARDVLAAVTALGYDHAILVGHDWGASIAYAAANIDPTKISKLVTLALPHPKETKTSFKLFWRFRHFLVFQFGSLAEWYTRRNNFAYIDYLYHYWAPSWKIPQQQIDDVKKDFARPGRLRAALQYYHFLLLDNLSARKTALYNRRISVPTLTFIGEEDGALALGMFDHVAQDFTGSFTLVTVPHAGHFVHREQPDVFIKKLLEFLKA